MSEGESEISENKEVIQQKTFDESRQKFKTTKKTVTVEEAWITKCYDEMFYSLKAHCRDLRRDITEDRKWNLSCGCAIPYFVSNKNKSCDHSDLKCSCIEAVRDFTKWTKCGNPRQDCSKRHIKCGCWNTKCWFDHSHL